VPKLYESDLDRVFTALGDGTRRDVIARLCRLGDATVGELASAYDMSLPSFSEHLGALERAGLVSRTRVGRHHRIAFCREALDDLRGWIDEVDSGHVPTVPSLPRSPLPDDLALIRRAEDLLAAAAPKMAVIVRVLDPQLRHGMLDGEDFSPEAHAVRRLAVAAVETPDVRGELVEAHALYVGLERALATARAEGVVRGLPAAVFPLARRLYAWQLHPVLADAFPRLAAAVN
jgi:DNA-binding transcriptional ArsR family regulator